MFREAGLSGVLLGWERQCKDVETAEAMPKGKETLEAFYLTVLSCSLATLLHNKCISSRERAGVAEGTRPSPCVNEREGAGKHLCVSVQGRGMGRQQRSALLSC